MGGPPEAARPSPPHRTSRYHTSQMSLRRNAEDSAGLGTELLSPIHSSAPRYLGRAQTWWVEAEVGGGLTVAREFLRLPCWQRFLAVTEEKATLLKINLNAWRPRAFSF